MDTPVTASLVPYLIVQGGAEALEFYQRAFGAHVTLRLEQPDGRLGHAELDIDGAAFTLADEFPEIGIVGPATLGGTSVTLHLTVDGVDDVVARAVDAGAELTREVADQFYGSRSGQLTDPFGHRWTVSTPIDEVSAEEMQRRLDEPPDDA